MKSTLRLIVPTLAGLALIGAAAAAPPVVPAPTVKPNDTIGFAAHRAVYDLKLIKSHGSRNIDSVRGRILYDFTGSACEGYTLQFRQVSELESGEGGAVLSDLRSTTWEDATASKFRFNSENILNDNPTQKVDGHADRATQSVDVTLSQPDNKEFKVPIGAVFPTEHMRRVIEAARAGKTILEFPVYDGSDNGEKVFNTLTVIGKAIAPGEKPPQDAAAKVPELAHLTRWPVTISYFEKQSGEKQQQGEQTPVYAISFELYENGISRALVLDYNDFILAGEMTSLELKKQKPCR